MMSVIPVHITKRTRVVFLRLIIISLLGRMIGILVLVCEIGIAPSIRKWIWRVSPDLFILVVNLSLPLIFIFIVILHIRRMKCISLGTKLVLWGRNLLNLI